MSKRRWATQLLCLCALFWLLGCGGSAAAKRAPNDATAKDQAEVTVMGAPGVAGGETLDAEDTGGGGVMRERDFAKEEAPSASPASTPPPARILAGKSVGDNLRTETRSSSGSTGALAQNVPGPQQGQGGPAPVVPKPGAKEKPKPPEKSDVAVQQSPMLIYTAQLTMAVFEVKKAIDSVEQVGRDLGGFLSRRTDQMIVIRVPAARFDEAVGRIEKVGDVVQRNVTTEDVTEEFTDLEVRLKSARAVRERLEQLLAKANKVEESVLIERELERVGGEIERIEGRMKFLRDRAAYSTITVTFQARRGETVGPDRFNLPVPWLYELGLRRLLTL